MQILTTPMEKAVRRMPTIYMKIPSLYSIFKTSPVPRRTYNLHVYSPHGNAIPRSVLYIFWFNLHTFDAVSYEPFPFVRCDDAIPGLCCTCWMYCYFVILHLPTPQNPGACVRILQFAKTRFWRWQCSKLTSAPLEVASQTNGNGGCNC